MTENHQTEQRTQHIDDRKEVAKHSNSSSKSSDSGGGGSSGGVKRKSRKREKGNESEINQGCETCVWSLWTHSLPDELKPFLTRLYFPKLVNNFFINDDFEAQEQKKKERKRKASENEIKSTYKYSNVAHIHIKSETRYALHKGGDGKFDALFRLLQGEKK